MDSPAHAGARSDVSMGSRSRAGSGGMSPGLGSAERGDRPETVQKEIVNQDGQDLELEVLQLTTDQLVFKASRIESSFANALRRVMLAEVPILAIDTVEVLRNDSVLHDEMLVHRLGLCPIETIVGPPTKRVNVARELIYPRDCDCTSFCSKCSVVFEMNVRCMNSTRQTVTSKDLINVTEPGTLGAEVSPVHTPHTKDSYPIVLVELARNQEVRLRCIARKGIGKEHARWNPTCTVAMQFVPEITLNERAFTELAASDKQDWIRYCPRKVYSYDKSRNRVYVNPDNVMKCFFCEECTNMQKDPFKEFKGKKQLVSVRRKKDGTGKYEFVFTVETTGCMKPEELVQESVRVLYDKINDAVDSLHSKLNKAGRASEIPRGTEDGSSRGGSPSGTPPTGPSPAYSQVSASSLGGMTPISVDPSSVTGQSGFSEPIPWN
eukprot:TRINITY_DN35699_c0_g1_i1.p1 TRINITY_DN35699_c0_g1~~TRINITY_DN35699_c0_g1_i1.p1  ORF type:complete len:436 (+),score=128.99 TRINITY_DN35699_c0_g1_i1:44-1351(+)